MTRRICLRCLWTWEPRPLAEADKCPLCDSPMIAKDTDEIDYDMLERMAEEEDEKEQTND